MTVQLTSRQIKAALSLLGWDQGDLADKTGMTEISISRILSGKSKPQEKNERAIFDALKDNIEFLDNQGVKLKPSGVEIFEGPERFEDFYKSMYAHLEERGGDVCLSCVDDYLFASHKKDPDSHRQRMADFVERKGVTVRVIATKSHFSAKWAQYRWQPSQSTAPTAFYAFGDCIALIVFDHPNAPYVVLHKSAALAEAYRTAFNKAWETAEMPPNE